MENHIDKAFSSGNWKDKIASSKYSQGMTDKLTSLPFHLADIDDRLKDLEHKLNRTERKTLTNRKEQILLMFHLGFFDKLKELNLSNKKLAKLLSVLLNSSQDNIEKDLGALYKPDSHLTTEDSFNFLIKTFTGVGLKSQAEKLDIALDKLKKKKI